jgi:transposase
LTFTILERNARRLIILDGINEGLTNDKIAAKLGVRSSVVKRDLRIMKYSKDQGLIRVRDKVKEKVEKLKASKAHVIEEKFHLMTGVTFKEMTFSNMMTFYEPEIRKVLKAEKQSDAISCLSKSVSKTLRRNGIIAPGGKTLIVTQKARFFLENNTMPSWFR